MVVKIPDWYILATSLIFTLSILGVIFLAIAAIQLLRSVTIILSKVNSLTKKVQAVSGKVSGLTTEVKAVIGNLSQSSAPMALAARDITATATTSFAKFAPIVGLVEMGIKLLEGRQGVKKDPN